MHTPEFAFCFIFAIEFLIIILFKIFRLKMSSVYLLILKKKKDQQQNLTQAEGSKYLRAWIKKNSDLLLSKTSFINLIHTFFTPLTILKNRT